MPFEAAGQSSGMAGERILGTGIDLVENARFRDVLSRWDERFLARVFLQKERQYCWNKAFPAQHFAGRFAIKEAVAKAFMTGIGSLFGWLDIEVVRNPATGAFGGTAWQGGRLRQDGWRETDTGEHLAHARLCGGQCGARGMTPV